MSQHRRLAPPGTAEAPRAGAPAAPARPAVSWRRGVPDGMVISVDASGDRSTVCLIGDLDLATAPEVRWALPRLAGRALVVDLSRLAFIDAAGLSSLLLILRHFERTGRRLHLHGAHGAVRRVFELSGLGHLVTGPDPT